MRLHHSNRMETLAAALAGIMRADPGDPFAPEWIVVPHRTVGRWLSFELARELGIAANLRLELPAGFAWSIMRSAEPELPKEQPFAPAQLRWRIHDVLPQFAEDDRAAGAAVRQYLADGDPRKRFSLADRLARVYDRCLVYRPEWVRAWESGDLPHWQARLWRRVVEAEGSAAHWVGAIDAFRGALASGGRPDGWPRRASFFAVPSLSPSYLDVLSGIGQGIDLNLFVLNPCREYWGDIYSRREIGRRAEGMDPGERYLTEGNELLAAWGRAGRDTFDSLVEIADGDGEEHFVQPAGGHRLAAAQRDVLELRLASEGVALAPVPVAVSTAAGEGDGAPRGDDSIRIHVCHSPVREVEVLHDRLLGLFDAHPDLGPADVLVLTPDLDTYGPVVEAVFGAADRIPFHAARRRSLTSLAVHAFFELLAVPRSRHGAEAVLAPLEAPAVRARFSIAEADLPAVRGWVREAGIRWGVDASHRADERLPATEDHAWRQGLDRLLLGYALPDPNELFEGVVPCPPQVGGFEAGAEEAALLGRFVTYCEAVFAMRTRFTGARHPREWAHALHEVIGCFFAGAESGGAVAAGTAETADEVGEVRRLVRDFEREAGRSGSPIGFEVVHDVLLEMADESSHEAVRLADGVTVTSLTPGQVFPAQIVCVIGLNDGVFPRSPSFPSFDLVAADGRRRGDRDVRLEDRFAFLEALLAARRAFLVSYTGRGQRDDAPIPPATVVDELKDYLAQRFPGVSFETNHPLQPFSPRYFAADGPADGGLEAETEAGSGGVGGGELFSYSEGMCEAARSLVSGGARPTEPARLEVGLPKPAGSAGATGHVDLAELIAFFANPVRWFLRERLGVRLELDDATLDEEEPFALGNLERYWLRSDILTRIRAGVSPRRDEALLRGSGRLPQAALGTIEYARVREEMEGLHRSLDSHRATLEAPPLSVDFEIDGCRVTGSVGNVGPKGLVWWRPGWLRERDQIEIRLKQLSLAASGHAPVSAIAISLDQSRRPKTTRFAAPDGAPEELLVDWLAARERGLSSPLPFFPETSLAYAKAIVGNPDEGAVWSKAHDAWSRDPSPWGRGGEAVRDPYLRLVYDGPPPLGDRFRELAKDLLVPLVEAMS